jgi:hypothetical protein
VFSCSCGWYREVPETDRNVSIGASPAVVNAMGVPSFGVIVRPRFSRIATRVKARIAGTHALPSAAVGMGPPQGV